MEINMNKELLNQIKELKRLLLAYNGEGKADYENILSMCVDAGSGGAGVNICDFLWEDWEDDDGHMHRGLIDKDYSPDEVSLYPNAIKDKLHLIQPSKYKVEMFKALIEMTNMNKTGQNAYYFIDEETGLMVFYGNGEYEPYVNYDKYSWYSKGNKIKLNK